MSSLRAGDDSAFPLQRDDLERARAPLAEARMLPAVAFVDPAVFAFEQRTVLSRTWRCVGHVRDLTLPGSQVLSTVVPEGIILTRSLDGQLHALSNVCTHRGALLMTSAQSHAKHVVCPYHRWEFALDGSVVRAYHLPANADRALCNLPKFSLQTWQGFLFVRLDDAASSTPLSAFLDDLVPHLERFDFASLRRGRRVSYEVAANWKLLLENFAESHHFPSVHPELERLTPTQLARSVDSVGPWQGGTMRIVDAETVSMDGRLHGRSLLPGSTSDDRDIVRDFLVWPTLLLSVQPDYLLVYLIEPIDVTRTRVIAEIYFASTSFKVSGLDASDVFEIWDRINAQDVEIVEQQQIGLASGRFDRGRLALVEDGVHRVERMIASAYLAALTPDATTA